MVSKRTTVRFDAQGIKKNLIDKLFKEQTIIFANYAEKELQSMIRNHTFKNDTYNTENSYCWCVYFKGKLESFGFGVNAARGFKKAKFKGHEVDGRKEAEMFVQAYRPTHTNGWEVVWAATTPYSTYLESGTRKMQKFLVISSQYDKIKKDFERIGGTVEFKINY